MFSKQLRVFIKKQPLMIILLIVLIIICGTVITSSTLLIRSNKWRQFEYMLTLHGDYDEIIYQAPIGFEEEILSIEETEDVGIYYELGTVTTEYGNEYGLACYKDEISEDLYHMSCAYGRYPIYGNEIAIDISVANALGSNGGIGDTVVLGIYDENGVFNESAEFVISGIFFASNSSVVGGWERYPFYLYTNLEYTMPSVFVSADWLETIHANNEVIFIQTNDNLYEYYEKLQQIIGNDTDIKFDYNDGRSMAYAQALGIMQSIWDKYGTMSMDNIDSALDDKYVFKDFYSQFLIPAAFVLIIAVAIGAIYSLVSAILIDRKDYYATVRSLGLTFRKCAVYLLIEMIVYGFLGALIGYVSGIGIHKFIIRLLNEKYNANLDLGTNTPDFINEVTYSPLAMCVGICLIAIIAASIIPIIKMNSKNAISYYKDSNNSKRTFMSSNSKLNNWFVLLYNRINFQDSIAFITMAIILSSALFGYVIFRACAVSETAKYQGYLLESNIGTYDYLVRKSTQVYDAPYSISNHHEYGINPLFIERISSEECTTEIMAKIYNNSTRVVFDEEPTEDLIALFGDNNLIQVYSNTISGQSATEGQARVFESMGYSVNDYMYELPTVGIPEWQIQDLESSIIAGKIDYSAIASGEEIIIAVPEYLADICLEYYPIGSELKISDVLLNDEEEQLDFGTEDAYIEKYHVYEETIIDEEGNEIFCFSSAYGRRYDITTRVGAIVVIAPELYSFYLSTDSRGNRYSTDSVTGEETEITTYSISILTLDNSTFQSWGLPDRNYTEVKIKLAENTMRDEFNSIWYWALNDSENVETISTYEYQSKIASGTLRVMMIFVVLIISLILLGIISIIINLQMKIRLKKNDICSLRMIGVSVDKLVIVFLSQCLYYPFISICIAVIPVLLCNGLFKIILNNLDSGKWVIDFSHGEPWYLKLPYYCNLFDFDFFPALLKCLLLGLVLVVLSALPFYISMRKHPLFMEE